MHRARRSMTLPSDPRHRALHRSFRGTRLKGGYFIHAERQTADPGHRSGFGLSSFPVNGTWRNCPLNIPNRKTRLNPCDCSPHLSPRRS